MDSVETSVTTQECYSFGALPKQFLITRKKIDPPVGWKSLQLGERYLFKSPELPATRVFQATEAAEAGRSWVILGWFVYGDSVYPNQETAILRTDAPIETMYRNMTGRFVILCADGPELRCITDPGALLPVVYRLDGDEAGSTPRALALAKPAIVSERRRASFRRNDATIWYPFGVTPFTGINRVLPGSILELPSGKTMPIAEKPQLESDRRDIVEQIHALARDYISALSASGTLECHLTAGWDSRMVLSACMKTSADIEYLTYMTPGMNGSIDCLISRRIAQIQSLRHKEVVVRPPRQRDIDAWLWRTADCVRDSVMKLTTTIRETYSDRYVLGGLAGEVGRAFYWVASDIGRYGLGAAELLGRLGFAESELAIDLSEQWLRRREGEPTPSILDQAYIDLRLGGWGGPSVYGHPVSKPTVSPFNNASIFSLMRALPEQYRRSGQFARDFVSLGSPTLAKIPVNRAYGLKRCRYLKRELAALLPKSTKSSLKALLAR